MPPPTKPARDTISKRDVIVAGKQVAMKIIDDKGNGLMVIKQPKEPTK